MSKMMKLLTLTAVLVLVLSGCKMVAVDKAATAQDNDTVVAEYKGGTILKGDAMKEYNDVVAMYEAYGYGDALDDAEFVASLKNDVLDYMVTDRVTQEKAKEFGVDAIPEEKRAELIQSATEQYNELVEMYRASFETEGMTDEEAIAATKAGLETQMGVNEQVMVNYELSDYKDQMLFDHVTKDVTVSDEDLKTVYDERVAEDKETYTEDPSAYDSATTYGDQAFWAPEGVRRVKHILIKGDGELQMQQSDIEDELAAVELAIEDKTAPADDEEADAEEEEELSIENGDMTVTEGEEAEPEAAVGGATVDNTGAEPVITEPDPTTVATAEPTVEPTVEPTFEPAATEEPAAEGDLTDEFEEEDSDEDVPEVDEADLEEPDYDAMTLDELNAKKAELEAQLADVKAKVQASIAEIVAEVQAKIAAGEDFDALIAEYGEDPGMTREPGMTEGYTVTPGTTMWRQEFTDGAMAIAEVGGVSEPVYTEDGCHIIKYVGDVPAGAVDFDSVKESLKESALETKKSEAYDAEIQKWTEAAEAKLYPDRM